MVAHSFFCPNRVLSNLDIAGYYLIWKKECLYLQINNVWHSRSLCGNKYLLSLINIWINKSIYTNISHNLHKISLLMSSVHKYKYFRINGVWHSRSPAEILMCGSSLQPLMQTVNGLIQSLSISFLLFPRIKPEGSLLIHSLNEYFQWIRTLIEHDTLMNTWTHSFPLWPRERSLLIGDNGNLHWNFQLFMCVVSLYDIYMYTNRKYNTFWKIYGGDLSLIRFRVFY